MAAYARVVGGVVAELIPDNEVPIEKRYTPELVEQMVVDDGSAVIGGTWDGSSFGAVPVPTPTTDMIKAEARRRILAAYPEWKQANLTARAVELNKIKASNGGWEPAEQTEINAIQSIWDWVKSVRAASDTLEGTLPTDYRNDEHWPASL